MAIVQVAYEISDRLLEGIVSRESVKGAKAVQPAADPAMLAMAPGMVKNMVKKDAAKDAAQGVAQGAAGLKMVKDVGVKAMGAVKQHPKMAVAVGAAAAVAGVAAIGAGVLKKHEPKELQTFRMAFKRSAVRSRLSPPD